MTIDEAQLRRLLEGPEDPPAPPSTVNLAQAFEAGRRKLRRHKIARAGTSALAVVAAVAIAVPAVGWLRHPARPFAGPVTGHARRSFNPLVPYAFFGRLPAGAREGSAGTSRTAVGLEVAGYPRTPWLLTVFSARACQLAGPERYRYRTRPGGPLNTGLAPQSIRCPSHPPFAAITRTALIGRAPRIGQADAYWINNFSNTGRDALAWQYAASGWAFVTPAVSVSPGPQSYYLSPSLKTRLHTLAAGVRFGGTAPLRFPFQLTKVPAGWGINSASIDDMHRAQTTTELAIGPADGKSAGLMMTWYHPRFRSVSRQSCGFRPSARLVHLGQGVIGYLGSLADTRTPWPGEPELQRLCVPSVHDQGALFIDRPIPPRSAAGATTGQSAPASFGFKSVIAVFKDLRFPPGGTTHPLG
jgi:hypothetical protein